MCIKKGSFYAGFKFVAGGLKNVSDKMLSEKRKSEKTKLLKFT